MFRLPRFKKFLTSWDIGLAKSRVSTSTSLLSKELPVDEKWSALATKQMKGKDPAENLMWYTQEGLAIKPIYTQSDISALPTGRNS